jgi:hypothetical protein
MLTGNGFRHSLALLAGFLACTGLALAQEHRHGAGVGFNFGIVDTNPATVDATLNDTIEVSGWNVFGKFGFTDHWAIALEYRRLEDDEDRALKQEFTQIGAYGLYMWRPAKVFRPHLKFGLVRNGIERSSGSSSPLKDDAVDLGLGGGFEAGSQRVAFFFELNVAITTLLEEDLGIGTYNLGVIFKF